MDYRDIKTLKGQVKFCLEQFPETRDSDIGLTIQIWLTFYGEGGGGSIELKKLYELPREDNVKRVRAYFQNVKKICLPTNENVARARGINIDEWRVAMGYPIETTSETKKPSWVPSSEKERALLNQQQLPLKSQK